MEKLNKMYNVPIESTWLALRKSQMNEPKNRLKVSQLKLNLVV